MGTMTAIPFYVLTSGKSIPCVDLKTVVKGINCILNAAIIEKIYHYHILIVDVETETSTETIFLHSNNIGDLLNGPFIEDSVGIQFECFGDALHNPQESFNGKCTIRNVVEVQNGNITLNGVTQDHYGIDSVKRACWVQTFHDFFS